MSDPLFSLAQNLSQPDDNRITYFGVTDTRNTRTPFGIKKEDRSRHTYVIGKTGMGKSTLLENMAVQDIQNGEGLCFIDPHGGTAEKLMEYIPEDRIKDVLYFAPFDMQYPISFNVLENVDEDKRHLVVAGLMSTFEKIWVDAWSARMAYILQNTLASLLEFPGATLLGVNRMYIDKEYRKNVIARITDPAVRSFWVDEYSKYTDRYAQEATPAIQNKIGQFASNALVRNVIGQSESSFNIRELMDQKKIFIVNLSKGRVGEGNANLLGSMLITKIYLAAMSRADISAGNMRDIPPFYLYVDEFQNFANKSFADILSEARKYKLALTIAHQYIEQMEEEVASAVFGNVGTMMTFRVGAYDAEVLEKEFAPTFTAEDLVNLGQRQIYLKLMIDGVSSQPFSAVTMPPIQEPEISHRDRAVAFSRAQYSRPREEVEKNISEWVGKRYEDPEAPAKEAARQERRAERDNEAVRPAYAGANLQGGLRPSYSPGGNAPRPPMSGGERPAYNPRPPQQGGFVPQRPAYAQTPRPYDRTQRPEGGPPRPAYNQSPRPYDRNAPPPRAPGEYVRHDDAPHQEVRTYVAPRTETPPPRTDAAPHAPAPARDTGVRRPFSPPRPLPPEKKQESVADLRAVLARMAPPKPTQPQPVADTSVPAPASVVQPQATPPVEAKVEKPAAPRPNTPPRPFQPRDDGKSVTEEGKQQLRNLLASLSTSAASQTASAAPTTPAPVQPTQPSTVGAPRPLQQVSHAPEPTVQRAASIKLASVPPVAQQSSTQAATGEQHHAVQRVPQHIRVQRAQVSGVSSAETSRVQSEHLHHASESVTVPQVPAEIPTVDLRNMLHVDKPDIA
jgi:hypothetical protein